MSPPGFDAATYWLQPPIIIKVGGSLFDWSGLGPRLQELTATWPKRNILLIPGGGHTADIVAQLDSAHRLGDSAAHWLALRAATLNAHFLASLCRHWQVVEGLNAARSVSRRGGVSVLDLYRFARGDEGRTDHLPHSWDATTDSFALRVAQVAEAERLILLKSRSMPKDMEWTHAASEGLVDPLFAALAAKSHFPIEFVDFLNWSSAKVD